MQLSDVFDALTTERSYKQALDSDAALAQMRIEVEKGWWDPALFSVFGRLAADGHFRHITPVLNAIA
jgi:putative two-component system response regulator